MDNATRVFVKEIKNGLASSDSPHQKENWLRVLKMILTEETDESEIENEMSSAKEKELKSVLEFLGLGYVQFLQLKNDIIQNYARRLLECVVSLFTVEWLTHITPQNFDVLVRPVFLKCASQDAFICLFETICHHERKDFLFHKCVSLLEACGTRQQLFRLLERHTQCDSDSSSRTKLSTDAEAVIVILSSLPEKMANRLQHENSNVFLPQHFIPTLAMAVYDCLCSAHETLSTNKDVSLLMISTLVGKLCLAGFADHLLDTLLPHLCVKVRSTDYRWCRICERVFSSMPARNLEPVVTALLKKVPWYGLVEKFLGDCVADNISIKNLVCVKLLLHKFYPKPRLFLHNVIGYLSSNQTRRHLYREVFMELLRVWGDKSSMKHISNEQHLYISKALMLCTSLINQEEKNAFKNDFLRILMPGVQAHLESNNHDMRMVGMAVAKRLIVSVDPDGPQLEFEIDDENLHVKDLLLYQGLPEDPGLSEAEKLIQAPSRSDVRQSAESRRDEDLPQDKIGSLKLSEADEEEELDSDDDLVPYDMSNDQKVTEAKAPKYTRDCMEGLIYVTDNPARGEVCLEHAEALIRKHTDGLEEISAEFAKILLHLNDSHSFDKFLVYRFSAMVALTATCPAKVADYLTSQFYERNYNTRQRLDILEVLANAAQELSQPKKAKKQNEPGPTPPVSEISPSSQPSSWREIVQKRIESNTRRFAKGRTQPIPIPTENRFAPVANQFFYPLMSRAYGTGTEDQPTVDLLGKDKLLLYRLLYTLAIVLHSATNLPNAFQMGRSLLEFTWPLRSHSDSCVRQAVLICTTTVFLVVPTFQLMSELHSDVIEVKCWLEDVFEKDADSECQKMAAQALLLLDEQIKKEVKREIPS